MSLGAPAPANTPTRAPDARAALVDALATVAGLSAVAMAPDVATAGAAWPRWIQTTYTNRLTTVTADDYDVYVVLPADYLEQTVDEGDRFRVLVENALWPVCRISYAEPVAIQFANNQSMPGLRFRVNTAKL